MFLYIASGIVLALLAIPTILRWIPPNGIYGFRVGATLQNRELWYDVNRYAGWRLLVVGLVIVVAAVGLARIPGITIDAYALACLAVFALALAAAVISTVRYMKAHK
jgi:uncharacterized membrane protein